MKRFLVLAACMVLLSGCTQSNIVNPESETKIADPNFDIQDDIEIDWTQVSADAESVFEDTGAYPYSKDFHFLLEPQKKEVMLVWVVSDDFPASEIRTYSDNLIKGFNDVVATQDFSIETSSDDSYGGLWKNYALSFGIAPESTQDDEETWFISGNFGVRPEKKSSIASAQETEDLAAASFVAPPICGAVSTFSIFNNGFSGSSGSFSNTSNPAPAIFLASSARINAGSSTIEPRAVLIR